MGIHKPSPTLLGLTLTTALFVSVNADAALFNGYSDASNNTSVFISVVERNSVNNIVRNLIIDTGARTLDVFAGNPWSTTAAQESEVLAFIASVGSNNTVLFNVGGALNELSYVTDLQGFVTTGDFPGPGPADLVGLANGAGNTTAFIDFSLNGTFNANGIQAANSNIDPGWHGKGEWGNTIGGSVPNNEQLLGAIAQMTGWRINLNSANVDRFELGQVTSNLSTGDISFSAAVIPVPAAAWLLIPAVALVTPWVKRRRA